MEILLPFIIIVIWLVLNHLRRHQFMKDYFNLQKQALEKGEKISFTELFQFELSRSQNFLRLAIIAIILGITLFFISFFNFPVGDDPMDLIFRISGITVGGFGIGLYLTWFFIDKPNLKRFQKKEDS